MSTLIDSYNEDSWSTDVQLGYWLYKGMGQSFQTTESTTLDSCKFNLKKVGSPTGNATAALYSHSGTYGSTGIPDTLLATSDNFDISSLSTSYSLATFNFSGANRVELSASTDYFIVVLYEDGIVDNYLQMAGSNLKGHSGNGAQFAMETSEWSAQNFWDYGFYVYGEDGTPTVGVKYPLPAFKRP